MNAISENWDKSNSTITVNFKCDIDPNWRLNPLFEHTKIQRIVDASLPFLSMHHPTSMLINTGLGLLEAYKISQKVIVHFKSSDWKNFNRELYQLSLVVSSIALSILIPKVHQLFSQSYHGLCLTHSLLTNLKNKQWKDAAGDCLELIVTCTYLSSIVYDEVELIALSLLIQAAKEIYQSIQEYKQGHIIESIAKLAMAAIRGHQTGQHLKTIHRNWFGKQLTQYELDDFTYNDDLDDFERFLIDKNISSHISGVSFNDLDFKKISNVKLHNCSFRWDTEHNFFEKVQFKNCLLQDAELIKNTFYNCTFINSNLTNASLYGCHFYQTNFTACDLTRTCFNDSLLYKVSYVASNMFETNFWGCTVINSKIIDSDLTDCLLLETKKSFKIYGGTPHRITRPVVGLAWNFESTGAYAEQINKALIDQGAIPLRFDYEPPFIDDEKLSIEVREIAHNIAQKKPQGMLSIADEIIKQAPRGSEIAKISESMKVLYSHMDAMVLPGGEDVDEVFYKDNPTFDYFDDFRRSIVEFSLMREAAQNKEKFNMGICRGSQLMNVYFGGTLKDVADHMGEVHDLRLKDSLTSEDRQFMIDIIQDDTIKSLSMHHQASDHIGKNLVVALEENGSPEALFHEDKNFLLTQFHPESCQIYKEFLSEYSKEETKKLLEESLKNLKMKESDNLKDIELVQKALMNMDFLKNFYAPIIEKNKNIFAYLIKRAQHVQQKRQSLATA